MHAALSLTWALVAIPDARQCLLVVGPVVGFMAVWWLVQRVDALLAWLFPHREWERRLGWLNIRAERRADSILRFVAFIFYGLLAVALFGIVWGAQGVALLDRMSEPEAMAEISSRLPILLASSGFWLIYLAILLPKLRRDHEAEELEKYRAERAALEREVDQARIARKSSSLVPGLKLPVRSDRLGPGQ